MNNVSRFLITVTLTVAAGTAAAAQMQDELDSPKPDFRTGTAVNDTRGARMEDVMDRPKTIARSASKQKFQSSASRSDRRTQRPLPTNRKTR